MEADDHKGPTGVLISGAGLAAVTSHPRCERDALGSVIIAHLPPSRRLVRNINEEVKNTANRILPPEQIIDANSILIKVLTEPFANTQLSHLRLL